ncbi:hypothetical protein Hanom_Chr11g01015021 [Helianthus anomalus]
MIHDSVQYFPYMAATRNFELNYTQNASLDQRTHPQGPTRLYEMCSWSDRRSTTNTRKLGPSISHPWLLISSFRNTKKLP